MQICGSAVREHVRPRKDRESRNNTLKALILYTVSCYRVVLSVTSFVDVHCPALFQFFRLHSVRNDEGGMLSTKRCSSNAFPKSYFTQLYSETVCITVGPMQCSHQGRFAELAGWFGGTSCSRCGLSAMHTHKPFYFTSPPASAWPGFYENNRSEHCHCPLQVWSRRRTCTTELST
jgi:hypothetical protein